MDGNRDMVESLDHCLVFTIKSVLCLWKDVLFDFGFCTKQPKLSQGKWRLRHLYSTVFVSALKGTGNTNWGQDTQKWQCCKGRHREGNKKWLQPEMLGAPKTFSPSAANHEHGSTE